MLSVGKHRNPNPISLAPRENQLASQEIGLAAEGSVEKLDGVHDGCLLMLACEGGLELQDAAGIAGGDDIDS